MEYVKDSALKRVLRTIRGVSLLCVALFASIECSLYVIGLPKIYTPHPSIVQFEDTKGGVIPYTNLRSTSIDFTYEENPRGYFRQGNVVQHHTNSAGMRGGEEDTVTSSSTYDVMFLGDSVTFGEGVYDEDTYAEQFERLANASGKFDQPVHAMNFGVGGYNTAEEILLLKETMKAGVRPDFVVVGYNMNDASEALFETKDGEWVRHDTPLEIFIADARSNTPVIARMLRSFGVAYDWYVKRQITEKTIQYYKDLYSDQNEAWKKTRDAMEQFGKFQEETGIPVVFLVFPRLFELQRYPFKHEREIVRLELQKDRLDSVFLYPELSEYKGPELWVYPADQHPNEIVHGIAADVLLKYFVIDQEL